MSDRLQILLARLRKGIGRTEAIFAALPDEQWQTVVYSEPYPWTARDLLAHLLSAEEAFLRLLQDIAAGGRGAPEGFDYDAYNAVEQERLAGIPPSRLLSDLLETRAALIAWLETLSEADLEREGYHPALGLVSIENFVNAIYGHQLLHMRDLGRVLS